MSGQCYPARAVAIAQALHPAWSIEAIRRIVQRELGLEQPPRWATVKRWVDPAYADKHRRANRLQMRRQQLDGARLTPLGTTVEYKLKRLRALHAAGLSNADVARVMALDFGGDWDRWHVQTVLDGGVPRILRRQRREREAA